MILTLPYPPSVNNYWRHNGTVTYISNAGKKYRSAVCAACHDQGVRNPDMRRLAVEITLAMPDKRKRDIDNALKALLDACTHARVWHDDEQIDRLTIVRGGIKKPGSAILLIKPANNDQITYRQAMGEDSNAMA